MNRQTQNSKDYEDEILDEGKESVCDLEDEELDASNRSTDSDSFAARAELLSAELSPRLPSISSTPFRRPILDKKAPKRALNRNGLWVIEALAMGDDSADENEEAMWRGVAHK